MYSLSRLHPSYHLKVRKFIDAARRHACRQKTKYIYCSCIECKNVVVFEDAEEISSHLVRRGFMKDYLIWVKHGEGSSTPYAEANSMHADGLNRDDRTRHQRPQTDPVMADLSDDHVGVQNACEDVDEVQVIDESEQVEFFEALLHRYSDPSMFLIKGMEALKRYQQGICRKRLRVVPMNSLH